MVSYFSASCWQQSNKIFDPPSAQQITETNYKSFSVIMLTTSTTLPVVHTEKNMLIIQQIYNIQGYSS